jgi:hypothetical protein
MKELENVTGRRWWWKELYCIVAGVEEGIINCCIEEE